MADNALQRTNGHRALGVTSSLWRCVAFVGIAALSVAIAHAEIEKIATPGPSGLSFSWWPRVVVPPGWQHERDQSLRNGINALSPKGASFSDAETVMYAKAVYKPREPNVKSLADLIAKDKKEFLAHEPSLDVREMEAIKAKDGRVFRTFSYVPKAKGNWERVAYGEETEFYLVFVLSSRTEHGYKKFRDDFEQLIRGYSEKP